MGRPADDHQRRRELPGLRRGRARAGDDEGLPAPGGALRRRVRQRRRHARRLLGAAVPSLGRGRGVPRRGRHRLHRRQRASAGPRVRGLAAGSRRLLLRRLRCGVLPGAERRGRRRRRLRDGGGDLPHEVRDQGDRRAPARRVPGIADHGGPGAGQRQDRIHHQLGRRRGARRSGRHGSEDPRRQHGRGHGAARRRALRRDRPRPEHEALRRTGSISTPAATSSRSRARPRRTSRASSRSATWSITSTARRSPRPGWAAWARSTRNGGSRPARAIWPPRSRRPANSAGSGPA